MCLFNYYHSPLTERWKYIIHLHSSIRLETWWKTENSLIHHWLEGTEESDVVNLWKSRMHGGFPSALLIFSGQISQCIQSMKLSWDNYHTTDGTPTEPIAQCAQTTRPQLKHSKKNLYVGLTYAINYSKGFIYSNSFNPHKNCMK